MNLSPGSPVTAVRGVGPVLGGALAASGIRNVADMLAVLPYRYEDRTNTRLLGELTSDGLAVTVAATVVGSRLRRTRRGGPTIVTADVADSTGAAEAIWFNQPYLVRSLVPGRMVWLYGIPQVRPRGSGFQLVSPELEFVSADEEPCHMGRAVPIYRRTGALSPKRWRSLIIRVLEAVPCAEDPLREWLPAQVSGVSHGEALLALHQPQAVPEPPAKALSTLPHPAATTLAYRRLAFEEFLAVMVALETERQRRRGRRAPMVSITDGIRRKVRDVLPFSLTVAQRRAIAEVAEDLQKTYPMARLLQGDVGSGKTVVAAVAALLVLASGRQVAFLAPTELLARQHLRTLGGLLRPAGFPATLLAGGLSTTERSAITERLSREEPLLVVGTHALLEESISFPKLGLAVIDEQHKFGVAQREALLQKGEAPHLLVLTATPIPRSVALAVYGDLETSVLDQLPPGRRPVRTVVRDDQAIPRLVEFLRREVLGGGRVFWVVPGIDEREDSGWLGVESRAQELRSRLPGIRIEVAHGRLPAVRREAALAAFAAGSCDLLCATTVVEVGIDVPEATVMVVEQAQRFGLAQLHQLRGRVGRGTRRSLCVALTTGAPDSPAMERLKAFTAITDGFQLAEEDLRLRGSGELTGLRQWGRAELRLADLFWHRSELSLARDTVGKAASDGRLWELVAALEALHPERWRWQAPVA